MLSDVNGEELPDDEDTMLTNASCPHCGASYEFWDVPDCEKGEYPYWQENNI